MRFSTASSDGGAGVTSIVLDTKEGVGYVALGGSEQLQQSHIEESLQELDAGEKGVGQKQASYGSGPVYIL